MMFSFAWRWSSLTQALALSREDYGVGKTIVSVVTGIGVSHGLEGGC